MVSLWQGPADEVVECEEVVCGLLVIVADYVGGVVREQVPEGAPAMATWTSDEPGAMLMPMQRRLVFVLLATLVAAGGIAWLVIAMRSVSDVASGLFPPLGVANPSWSPDGRKIAFQWDQEEADHIWVVNVETGDLTKLTHENLDNEQPVWSPDGARIAYTRLGEFGGREVAVMDDRGSQLVRISGLHPFDAPVWSSNGKELIVESDGMLYAVRADGTSPRRRLQGGHAGKWSPDRRWIAWGETTNERYGVWLMAASGGGEKRIVPKADSPTWSPDSRHIAFSRGLSGIFVADIHGRGIRRLPIRMPGGPGPDGLAWSPDGRTIAFVKGGVLYLVGIDGRGLRALANG